MLVFLPRKSLFSFHLFISKCREYSRVELVLIRFSRKSTLYACIKQEASSAKSITDHKTSSDPLLPHFPWQFPGWLGSTCNYTEKKLKANLHHLCSVQKHWVLICILFAEHLHIILWKCPELSLPSYIIPGFQATCGPRHTAERLPAAPES